MGNRKKKHMESDLANRVGDQFEQNNFCHTQSCATAMTEKNIYNAQKVDMCSLHGSLFVKPNLNDVFLKKIKLSSF